MNLPSRMGKAIFASAATLAIAASPAPAQHYSETEIDITVFHEELAPHGDWVAVQDYGWVWTPGDVPPGWRPYTTGQWTYTDEDGWLWVDEAPWGWATFHYGRWYYDDTFGWAWVPDTEWAPAWVAWRTDDEYVGWAPLPPQAKWRAEIGLDLGGLDIDVVISPSSWCFVAEREVFEPRVYTRAVIPARNVTLVQRTRYETRYTVRERRIVNAGISIERVEQRIGRPVPRARVRPVHSITTLRTSPRVVGREVSIFRPRVVRKSIVTQPPVIRTRPPQGAWGDNVTIRQKSRRSALKEYDDTQRAELERLHRRELDSAAPDARTRILERHAAERRMLDQNVQRREAQMERRQRLEREGVIGGRAIRQRSNHEDDSGRDRERDGKKKTVRKKRP